MKMIETLRLKYGKRKALYKLNTEGVCEYFKNLPKLPRKIEIETINRCNGKCSFCPVNANEPQRPYAKMKQELFEKIINELEDAGYAGMLSLFSNNEPFLDERIIQMHKFAREHVPNARIVLYSNGTLLTKEKVEEIVPYLDKFVVDNYSDTYEMSDEMCRIKEFVGSNESVASKVMIEMRKQNEVLTSRGGAAPNKHQASIDAKCILPFQQFVIRPDGKISLCCNDALGKYTLGDCNTQSILEIWNSDQYQSIRQNMVLYGRKSLDLCEYCDTLGGEI